MDRVVSVLSPSALRRLALFIICASCATLPDVNFEEVANSTSVVEGFRLVLVTVPVQIPTSCLKSGYCSGSTKCFLSNHVTCKLARV